MGSDSQEEGVDHEGSSMESIRRPHDDINSSFLPGGGAEEDGDGWLASEAGLTEFPRSDSQETPDRGREDRDSEVYNEIMRGMASQAMGEGLTAGFSVDEGIAGPGSYEARGWRAQDAAGDEDVDPMSYIKWGSSSPPAEQRDA
ncbi:hypothetical protein CVT26_015161 [Gymnopilus dilepis]|uniref:Uncharacterized protein n=1 Tax=Gymnopilus dilepis TaxID=231916 RepID=A0A409WA48_9AGAR|nr:hypothetical protein CVT26_015161 [Gymnopilus dilepis]